jgi:hypothetical protein
VVPVRIEEVEGVAAGGAARQAPDARGGALGLAAEAAGAVVPANEADGGGTEPAVGIVEQECLGIGHWWRLPGLEGSMPT